MGAQPVKDVLLIRHAYVETEAQRQGVGGALIADLLSRATSPVLVGTWAAAAWAVGFYRKHGFERVMDEDNNRLLQTYWSIPDRQIETSVVLRLVS
jgi:GNAT superfamily N-acetyltransferase